MIFLKSLKSLDHPKRSKGYTMLTHMTIRQRKVGRRRMMLGR
jgi:hypothetical protein